MSITESSALIVAMLIADRDSSPSIRGAPATSSLDDSISAIYRLLSATPRIRLLLESVVRDPRQLRVDDLASSIKKLAAEDGEFDARVEALLGQAFADVKTAPAAIGMATSFRIGGIGVTGEEQIPDEARLLRVQPSAPTPNQAYNLPARNLLFYDRFRQLGEIRSYFAEEAGGLRIASLCGLGGVGKTQLALEYAHSNRGRYGLIWWITAEQAVTLQSGLRRLAVRLGIDASGTTDIDELVDAISDRLFRIRRWLLIYDNISDKDALEQHLPACDHGNIILTSRNPSWVGVAATMEIPVFGRNDAVSFLVARSASRGEPSAAVLLAEALGDLPIALEQAAAYMEETQTSIMDYLALLRGYSRQLFNAGRPANSNQTVASTWALALEKIRSENEAAIDMMGLCSYLAPDDIPRKLFEEVQGALPPGLGRAVSDQFSYNAIIRVLRKYSMIQAKPLTISLHRLVQAVIRQRLSFDEERVWCQAAIHAVNSHLPRFDSDANAWVTDSRDYSNLLSHAISALDHARDLGVGTVEVATLANKVALYLLARAELRQAKSFQEFSLTLLDRVSEAREDVARGLNDIGAIFREIGHLNQALQLHERALEMLSAMGHQDNLPIADTLSHQALLLRRMGHPERARELYKRAVGIREAAGQADTLEYAQELSSLGVVLTDLGDQENAEDALRRALAILYREVGRDHVRTATAEDNLGQVLSNAGRLDEALELLVRAREVFERHLGEIHPEVAWSWFHIGNVFLRRGELVSARQAHERSLAIRESLVPVHPNVVDSLRALAAVLVGLDESDAARDLRDRAVAMHQDLENGDV